MNPITFSTLACPAWSIKTVIAKAAEFGYDGIEWRGGSQGHIHPTLSASQITSLQQASANAGLFAVAVTAYTSFVSPLAKERQASLDELRRYSDFAAELDAPYVRAFLGEALEQPEVDALANIRVQVEIGRQHEIDDLENQCELAVLREVRALESRLVFELHDRPHDLWNSA